MCLGRKLQRVRAAMEKPLAPQVRCLALSGGDRRLASEERKLQEAGCRWSRAVRQQGARRWRVRVGEEEEEEDF